ncbi:MAG: hypothetical protein J6J42_07985 [Lachnospiraceae bacterium]|nr:hypothetical protein [Lachnospiraceae bacterium]
MGDFLLKLLELSLWAGILTVVVLGIRLAFRKIPAKYLCVLWMIVAARLVLPFSLETSFAPLPSFAELSMLFPGDGEVHGVMTEYHAATVVPSGEGADNVPGVPEWLDETDYDTGDSNKGSAVTMEPVQEDTEEVDYEEVDYYITSKSGQVYMEPEPSDTHHQNWLTTGTLDNVRIVPEYVPAVAAVWMTGVVLLLAYGVAGCLKVKRMVKNAILYQDNVWLCEGLESPFLFGWVHPKIYLPCDLEEVQMQYVIEHEKSHIARGDHFAKLAGYVLLAVYWFNPLIWVAYVMFCKDVERACDERVIAEFGVEDRKGYAEALLECSVGCGFAISHPLAFGEMDVKKRIGGILKYQKPGKWLTVVAVVLCVLSAAGCFMVQKAGQDNQNSQQFEVSPTPQLTVPPAEATPTVAPSSEQRGNGPATPTPMEAAPTPTISAGTPTPLPPSGLELLGKTTQESVIAVPMGQTISVDLDGDGTEESVTFGIKGYEGNVSVRDILDSIKYTWDEFDDFYFLKIDDTVFWQEEIALEDWEDGPGTTTYYIFDIDMEDKYKEIGVPFSGPSNDPSTIFYRYVDGKLRCVGGIGDTPLESDYRDSYEHGKMPYDEMVEQVDREEYQITVLGDGNILLSGRVDVLETSWSVREYNLWNATSAWGATLKETIRERYEFIGWDYDAGEMYNSRTKKDLTAYSDRFDITSGQDTASTVFIPEGTRMSIYSYYPDNGWTAGWIQFAYGENLDSFAWFYKGVDPTGKFLLYFPGETVNWPDDVFENLNHAD